MKKILLAICLISSIGFSKGLVVKGGVEFNYSKDNLFKDSFWTDNLKKLSEYEDKKLYGTLGVEYGFEVYKKNKMGVEIVPGVDFKIGSLLKDKSEKNNNILTKIGVNLYIIDLSFVPNIKPMFTYKLKDTVLKAGLKLGVGVTDHILILKTNGSTTTINENDKDKKIISLVVPFGVVLGVDYKKFVTNLEVGGEYSLRKYDEEKFDTKDGVTKFALGLNLGYRF